MSRVLVLRPEPGASATVDRARGRGLEAVAVPLFEIEPVHWEHPEASGFDGLLLTSANAVRHGGKAVNDLRGLPVYAVGAATADAARHAGFDLASKGDAGVDRLLASIEPELRLLHLAGEDRIAPEGAQQKIESITVYRSVEKTSVDLGDLNGIVALVHSPRAGRRFAQLVGHSARGSVAIAAISLEAATAAGDGWASVDAAEAPNDEALLALTERLCNNPAPR
jgi:uroporphyrinogen-III synthase